MGLSEKKDGMDSDMVYISLNFYVFVAGMVLLYYAFPKKFRWIALLAGSLGFYYRISGKGWWMFAAALLAGYGMGIVLERVGQESDGKEEKARSKKTLGRWILAICVIGITIPLAVTKIRGRWTFPWIVPVGLSFYTLQLISYLVDVYYGKIRAQRNFGKFALFVLFFPQIVQGPIHRYGQLGKQLYEGHEFEAEGFCRGLQLIVWGFFLKLMIADKAAVVVNEVFLYWEAYKGCYVLVAGALYSIQLYTDFLSCVSLARGTAELFGIHLTENFKRPYLAGSVKEFWGRWHISLSTWLRDYIYIPLGGNRKGKLRKYANIFVVFTVSGLWHGTGYKYLFWGWMHALYQIGGELTEGLQNRIYDFLFIQEGSKIRIWLRRMGTWFLVMLAWIIFRAEGLRKGLAMVCGMFTTYNPWIFFDDSLLRLGLSWKEWGILLVSAAVLWKIDGMEERVDVRTEILRQPLIFRWGLYLLAVAGIMIFGSYGFGFNAADFIYGGF